MGRAYLSSFLFAHAKDEDRDTGSQSLDWGISSSLLVPKSLPLSLNVVPRTTEIDVFAFGMTVMEVSLLFSVLLSSVVTICHEKTFAYGKEFASGKSQGYIDMMVRSFVRGHLPERPQFGKDMGLTDELWLLVSRCSERDPEQRPTMASVACIMVELAEASLQSHTSKPAVLPRTLKDISAEIKKRGEHPIAHGGYCDLYLGERLGSETVALKLVRLFGSADADKDSARRVSSCEP